MEILNTINSPSDLRALPLEQMPQLAQEIRARIIDTVAETGGHLAANLGVVELSLALHYAFNTPQDKIVWDVGHQCYTHKILTGRRDQFSTLRQDGGISGFCNRQESQYDTHTTGHSSNSISLALGMAVARDLSGADYQVAAVIGDGSLTGGMALEALDHAGDLKKPLIVILNDNEMSINGNVGAISAHLSRIRTNPRYARAKSNVRGILSHLPGGESLSALISSLKTGLKSAIVPGMLFEDLGFVYLGPIDGHDIHAMVELFRQAQHMQKPVLIHVRTTKGKGYTPAETFPERWHGASPFYIESGLPKNGKSVSYSEIFGKTLAELADKDTDIVAITAAMGEGTGLSHFCQQFPDRFFDVAIAEQHATTFAAGLAAAGKKPVFAVYSTFLQRAYDQVMEDVCLQRLPVVFAIDRAGLVGGDGCSHQGIFDISYLRAMPGMTILAPADGEELKMMLRYAFSLQAPVALRYPRMPARRLEICRPPLQYGCGVKLTEGADAAIFALGSMVETALAVQQRLKEDGLQLRVVNARFAAPLDTKLLDESATACGGRIITLEEGVSSGGFGEACAAALASAINGKEKQTDILICALPSAFPPHGERGNLLRAAGLQPDQLAEAIRERWFQDGK